MLTTGMSDVDPLGSKYQYDEGPVFPLPFLLHISMSMRMSMSMSINISMITISIIFVVIIGTRV